MTAIGEVLNRAYVTDWFIFGTIMGIAVADLFFLWVRTKTISNRLRYYGYEWASFPFAWGALGGHFWGPPGSPFLGSWFASIGALVVCMFVVMVLHWQVRDKLDVPAWSVVFWILPGIAAGAHFWPQ